MAIFSICAIIFFVVLIFSHFYTWTGLRTRRLMSQIPGYSEAQSWILNFEAAVTPTEGIIHYVGKIVAKYPSILSAWYSGIPFVTISSPEYLKVVLQSVQHIKKGMVYNVFKPWLREGLLLSNGKKWHANRKMLTPAFHFRILKSCLPIFNFNSHLLVKFMKDKCDNGETLKMENFIALCSLDIISEAAMGVKLDAQLNKPSTTKYVGAVRRVGELGLQRAMNITLTKQWLYNLSSGGRENMKLLKILHGFTENVIKESKQKRKMEKVNGIKDERPNTLVDFLLEMSENEPGSFTDLEIRQEVDTFMFAGHETITSSVSWSLLLLGNDEEVQQRAYQELVAIFDENDRDVTQQDLAKMTYLEAVIKESLRLYPPVCFMSRELESDLEIEKYTVPKGANIVMLPYFLHRNSQLYPDPEKFNPDRFLNVDKLSNDPFTYIPFSAGPRNCMGQRFAMMEMKVMISFILRHFRIESVTKRDGLKLLFAPILKPVQGTFVKLYPRVSSTNTQ